MEKSEMLHPERNLKSDLKPEIRIKQKLILCFIFVMFLEHNENGVVPCMMWTYIAKPLHFTN